MLEIQIESKESESLTWIQYCSSLSQKRRLWKVLKRENYKQILLKLKSNRSGDYQPFKQNFVTKRIKEEKPKMYEIQKESDESESPHLDSILLQPFSEETALESLERKNVKQILLKLKISGCVTCININNLKTEYCK